MATSKLFWQKITPISNRHHAQVVPVGIEQYRLATLEEEALLFGFPPMLTCTVMSWTDGRTRTGHKWTDTKRTSCSSSRRGSWSSSGRSESRPHKIAATKAQRKLLNLSVRPQNNLIIAGERGHTLYYHHGTQPTSLKPPFPPFFYRKSCLFFCWIFVARRVFFIELLICGVALMEQKLVMQGR